MDPARVADRSELRDLVFGYARAADRGDRSALEALFLPDATLTVRRPGADPHTYEGAAALGEIVPRLGRYARTFHLVANHWCEVSGATATGEAYCEAHHVRLDDGAAVDVVLTISYVDAYARTEAGWRFASREVQILWTRELPLASGPLQNKPSPIRPPGATPG
jgi:ketosteroid isomerase-like protein